MNFVAVREGARTTLTAKEQEDVRCCASRAVQVTGVFPTGRLAPLAGAQVVVTGVAPPATVGAGKMTGTEAPSTDVVVWLAGQEIVGGAAGSFVGPESPQPDARRPQRQTSPANPALRLPESTRTRFILGRPGPGSPTGSDRRRRGPCQSGLSDAASALSSSCTTTVASSSRSSGQRGSENTSAASRSVTGNERGESPQARVNPSCWWIAIG